MVLLDKLVVPLVALVLTPILIAVINRGLAMLQKKLDIDVTERQKLIIDELVRESIAFAEEQARKASRGEKTEIEGVFREGKKMDAALKYLEKRARQVGVDELVKDQADALAGRIESMLFETRPPGE
jgi:hypothetical protein